MLESDREQGFKYALWLNLFVGFYNIYLWSIDYWWFNIFIGSINIGVWVFNRDKL